MSTSASSHMRMRSATPSQQDRLSQIRGIFPQAYKGEKTFFNPQELKDILSLKSGKYFSDALLQELIQNIPKSENAQITIEDFVMGYYTMETSLTSQIDIIKKQLKDNSLLLTNTKRQYIEAKANRIPEDNNVLTVTLKRADVKSNKPLVARVICDEWEVTTNAVVNFMWVETFTFNPMSHRDLVIEIWESEKGTLIADLGQVEIPLSSLRDEEVHEGWNDVMKDGKKQGSLLLVLQWVQVKAEYLEKIVKRLEKVLKEHRAELEVLEKKYEEMVTPVNGSAPQWFLHSPEFKKAELELSKQLDVLAVKTFGKEVKWPIAMKVTVYTYLTLAVLSTFLRPDFVNLIIASTALLWHLKLPAEVINYKFLSIAVLLSQFNDFCWLFFFSKVRFKQDWFYSDALHRSILIIILSNFLLKVAFAAIFWKNSVLSH